jgi:hypothetical protein
MYFNFTVAVTAIGLKTAPNNHLNSLKQKLMCGLFLTKAEALQVLELYQI